MEFVRRWIEDSPYTRTLGVELIKLDENRTTLRLPYDDALSNGDRVMHGGCAASLSVAGAQVLTRASHGEDSGPWLTVGLQVNYLAAAKGQGVMAEARLLRLGKELCFVDVDVRGDDGRAIAHATCVARAQSGTGPQYSCVSSGDHGESDPGVMGPHIGKIPFMGGLGIAVEHMAGGTSRLVMPFADSNADANGSVHEGAALALLDTTGAMAAWAETGPGPFRAGTPSVQAQIIAPPPKDDLVAYGRVVQRDGAILWSDVEVASASDGHVCARGTVIYRIVT